MIYVKELEIEKCRHTRTDGWMDGGSRIQWLWSVGSKAHFYVLQLDEGSGTVVMEQDECHYIATHPNFNFDSTELVMVSLHKYHKDFLDKYGFIIPSLLEQIEPLALPENFNDEDTKQRFADMANRYQKEKAEGKPPHLFEP
jgi:hypothetical protein